MSTHPLLFFGLPEGAAAILGAALAVLLFALPNRFWTAVANFAERHEKLALLSLCLFSAYLSRLYFVEYLGGGPRVIDATAYLAEGRILETLRFTFEAPEPATLFRGRFLLSHPENVGTIGVIFPPGYPVLLALGEALGSYEWVGPALAGFLGFLSHRLALTVTKNRKTALLAALFSVACASLHYHTADTMSHAWSACLGLLAALAVLSLQAELSPRKRTLTAFALGLSLGWLLATRQLTGLVFAMVALGFLLLHRRAAELPWRVGLPIFFGFVPGLALLAAHHYSLTGSVFTSPQELYYAVSDGPAGCFGLGLGKGCEFEHGELYRAWKGHGLTAFAALQNTLRRLHHHSLDLGQFELFLPLVIAQLWLGRRTLYSKFVLALLVVLPLAYCFFYFDGSYQGAGARFFFELLPFEFVALAQLAQRSRRPQWFLAVSLLGFACHARPLHEYYRTLPPGRPYLLESEVERLGEGVLFVESDHAFLLGLRPKALLTKSNSRELIVARASGDQREGKLLENLGVLGAVRLTTHAGQSAPSFVPWVLPIAKDRTFIEAESLWPAVGQHELWIHPSYPVGSCVSQGRGLTIHRAPLAEHGRPAPRAEPGLMLPIDGAEGLFSIQMRLWVPGRECLSVPVGDHHLPGRLWLASRLFPEGEVHIDGFEIQPLKPSPH